MKKTILFIAAISFHIFICCSGVDNSSKTGPADSDTTVIEPINPADTSYVIPDTMRPLQFPI